MKWKKPKKEDGLCTWDFCTSCINYRIKNKLPIPKLKSHKYIK